MDLKTEIIDSQRNTSAESGGDVEQKRDKFKSGKGLDLLGCFQCYIIHWLQRKPDFDTYKSFMNQSREKALLSIQWHALVYTEISTT